MSTFIINLNDTVAMSDSAVVELAKVITVCKPCVQEAGSNCNDVKIVVAICITVAFVAFIAALVIWLWKRAVINSQKQEHDNKVKNEKKEIQRKKCYDLIEKRIDALKCQAVIKDKDGKITGYKESISDDFKAYDNALKEYINKSVAEVS